MKLRVQIKTINEMRDEGYRVHRRSNGALMRVDIPCSFNSGMENLLNSGKYPDRIINVIKARDTTSGPRYLWDGEGYTISDEMIKRIVPFEVDYIGGDE